MFAVFLRLYRLIFKRKRPIDKRITYEYREDLIAIINPKNKKSIWDSKTDLHIDSGRSTHTIVWTNMGAFTYGRGIYLIKSNSGDVRVSYYGEYMDGWTGWSSEVYSNEVWATIDCIESNNPGNNGLRLV